MKSHCIKALYSTAVLVAMLVVVFSVVTIFADSHEDTFRSDPAPNCPWCEIPTPVPCESNQHIDCPTPTSTPTPTPLPDPPAPTGVEVSMGTTSALVSWDEEDWATAF